MKEQEIRGVLTSLLSDSGADWKEENGYIRFRLERKGLLWETGCRCRDGEILIYGRYPFRTENTLPTLKELNRINSRLLRGSLFLDETGGCICRTRAEMDDFYMARERLIAALEYNAQVIAHFREPLSRRGVTMNG